MASPPGSYLLVRNKRHSIRIRVPTDLVPRFRRTELVRALGTSDRRTARFIVAGVALRLGLFWAMTRRCPPLTPEELRRLADDWLRRAMDNEWKILERGDFADAMAPAHLNADGRRAFGSEMFGVEANQIADLVAAEASAGNFRHFDSEAGEVLAAAGHGKRTGSQERAVLSKLMLERYADLQATKIAWSDGNFAEMPPQLTAPAPPWPSQPADKAGNGPNAAPVVTSRSIATATELFISRMRQLGAKKNHIIDAQSDLTLLVEAFGKDYQVSRVTPADAGFLWEQLQSLPPHFRTHPELKGLGLFEKAKKSRELKLAPLSFRSVNSYFVTLQKLFDHELRAGHVATNSFIGKRMAKPSRFVEQDRTLGTYELEVLFACPIFQGAKTKTRPYDPGDYLVDDWMFWAPLIALFTGARIGEIAQLRPADIRVVEGVAVVDINEDDGKTLKNRGTARLIPVHKQLAEIGLIRLAARQQAAKARFLLPSMPAPVLDDPGKAPSAWMSERLLPRLKLKTRKGLGFHSLRHSLKTLLRNALVPDSISNNLCGHDDRGRSGVGAGYGRIEVGAMKEGLEKIVLPEAVKLIKPRFLEP